jgi:hypothetical protein
MYLIYLVFDWKFLITLEYESKIVVLEKSSLTLSCKIGYEYNSCKEYADINYNLIGIVFI